MVVGWIIRIAVSVIAGLIFDMSIMGMIILAVALIAATEIISRIVVMVFGLDLEDEDSVPVFMTVTIIFQVIFLVIILINYSGNKDERYVPEMAIGASRDGKESLNSRNIPADTPFYLQIRVAVQSNSLARRLLGKNDIPFAVEISNSGGATFSEPQNMQFCKETKPKENDGDTITYFFTVVASGKPRQAVIDFTVTPAKTGSQGVKITYDKKVSDIHTKTVTLEYK